MVDVSDKQITKRTAVAHPSIIVSETIYKQISNNTNTKGNVLNAAQIAGIMTARDTLTITPMCHPLPLAGIDVHSNWDETSAPLYTLNVQTIISTTGETGAEVEALAAVSATTLAIYDMTKVVDESMVIDGAYLESKSGGKSGDFQR